VELVPTINIDEYRRGTINGKSLKQLETACRDHGFFLLTGHGLNDLIDRMWQQTRIFFASDDEIKRSVLRTESNPLGFYNQELTKQKRDLKEVFDFKAGGYMSQRSEIRSQWPAGMPEFKNTLSDYFQACTSLAEDTIALVFASLDLPSDKVEKDFGDIHTSSMRLNYYPVDDPLTEDERQKVNPLGDMALHHHTDPGSITLLIQDDTGGLQTFSKEHGWIDIPPAPGTFVVNLGDALQVQTNDQYTAALHRVIPMTNKVRYSTPFFYQPRFDSIIEPLDIEKVGEPLYRGFSWRDYIKARITDNYSDIGEEDIQITRYKIR
jgi:isopenicillin N synthase-like dioxygenase